jgi:hypothetical protein
MKLTATMMLSVDGVHQAPEAATSPAHVSSIAAASKLRVTGTQTGNMAFYLRTFFRLLSSWGRGVMSREIVKVPAPMSYIGSGSSVSLTGPAPCAESSAFRETVARRAERGGQLLVHSMRGRPVSGAS